MHLLAPGLSVLSPSTATYWEFCWGIVDAHGYNRVLGDCVVLKLDFLACIYLIQCYTGASIYVDPYARDASQVSKISGAFVHRRTFSSTVAMGPSWLAYVPVLAGRIDSTGSRHGNSSTHSGLDG